MRKCRPSLNVGDAIVFMNADTSATIVAWIPVADGAPPGVCALNIADESGFMIVALPAGSPMPDSIGLRILDSRATADEERIRAALHSSDVPTLVVVTSAETESKVVRCLRVQDDVAHGSDSATALGGRLARLRERAHALGELGRYREHIDPLTDLPGRVRCLRWLQDDANVWPVGGSSALLFLDCDNFKGFNERWGREAGDRALMCAAARLRDVAGPDDLLFRLELEEFVVLLRRDVREAVIADAEALRRAVSRSVSSSGEEGVSVTASGGLAFLGTDSFRYGVLVRAERAMLMAKVLGRDRLVLDEDVERLARQHGLSTELADLAEDVRAAKTRLEGMASALNQRQLEQALHEANHDALTRIYNRRYFDARIAREIDLARCDGRPLTLALLDIDDFRLVNNTLGHPTGDAALRAFAAVASRSIRSVDWLARYGGEEFCLVMPTTLAEGRQVAERIRENVMNEVVVALDGTKLTTTISAGVVWFDPAVDGCAEDLVHRASKACRAAKDAGKNRVA